MKDTNWRAELETFGKGVADDSHEAQEIMHKGLSNLESFPRQATAHLPAGLGTGLEGFGEQISGGVDPTQVQQRINKVCSLVYSLHPLCRSTWHGLQLELHFMITRAYSLLHETFRTRGRWHDSALHSICCEVPQSLQATPCSNTCSSEELLASCNLPKVR